MNKNEKNAYKDCLMDGYKELFRCTQSAKPEEYTRFVAMRGEKYDSLDPDYSCRLMIVGRAVNGWNRENLEYESEETFVESAVKCFEDSQRFSTEWKLNPCGKDKYYSETDGKKYHLSRSPFWNYSWYIWKKLARGVEAEGEGDWLKYIAWSNLYKVSPRCGGNPDNLLCSMQAKTCIDILRAEIQLLNPTHILMPVSESWFSWSRGDFSSIFRDGSLGLKEKCISSGDFRLVKRIFESDSLKIVVTNRPERRKRAEYVVEVMRAFDGKVGF